MVRWLNAKLTIPLPEDEYMKIKRHPEVKWGAIARVAVLKYADTLEKVKESIEKSENAAKA
jgi:hypothetical protein